ncbi:unnamed protein product [Heterotrigona itama]|uniref:Uncharacterized protein n=1 Tax=Heterotrigona itama TaxID=395501 RepID=A0A6V7HHI1_9HYME|nr:unnamed protein product [Heterotrigona itama]
MPRSLDEFGLVATDTDVNLCLSCVHRTLGRIPSERGWLRAPRWLASPPTPDASRTSLQTMCHAFEMLNLGEAENGTKWNRGNRRNDGFIHSTANSARKLSNINGLDDGRRRGINALMSASCL